MLATLEGPIRIQLHTLIHIRGTNHADIVHLQINPHTRNILGRTYYQLFLTPGTQELAPHITLSSYNHIKGITRRRADKLHWTVILLHNVGTLEIYENAIRQAAAAAYNIEAGGAAGKPAQESSPHTTHQPADVSGTSAQGGRGGGRVPRPRPTKVHDPVKAQRDLQHAQ